MRLPKEHPPLATSTTVNKPSYWSKSLQAVLDQPPASFPNRLILGGIVFSGIFTAWAWFGQVQQVGRAQGRLVPQGDVYRVQPASQGEISKITVKEGQRVYAGQVLVECDSRLDAAEVERLEKQLLAFRLEWVQTQGLIEQAQLGVKTRQAITKADTHSQQIGIHQAQNAVATNQVFLTNLQSDYAAHEARVARLKPLVEQGVLSEEHLFQAEQVLRDRQRSLTQSQGELQKSLIEAERLQSILEKQEAEGKQIELEAEQQLKKLMMQANQLQAKITETKMLLDKARTNLDQKFLYAPINGIVSSLNVQNVGEIAQPGQTIVEIAPADAPLVLSALLPNQEAGLVKEGMPVQIKLDAFPYQDYGVISGKVTSISPDAKLDEHLGAVYRVEIALEQDVITHNDRKISLKTGQTATAEILIRQRRIIDILLDPIRQIQQGGITL
ncbi:HlyD family efflux transporter periplasmic adaptor subunit [Leptothermofonsia sichuanensis E412]|uniref:HlyD family efflux transporter periplasmic adaptor subunit n=1 Tax=Leptothermofonsia sichuanensis TaxID=2917832 RepID=UPI001CA5F7ED|nr:HlyD family efflux transporter periplasmic adaptor subunit [Leptothermofonsia sichuanensis]QZZ21094.1 HlyD family efflux transporter periplasmic adaptor subunit [Leptothermofonsia sichuanensis E412]